MRFDSSRDGKLGRWEFTQAWYYLGLKGTENEITSAFNSVDSDNSGLVDLNEFISAIRTEKLMALNLKSVLDKMGVKYATDTNAFEAFKKAQARRPNYKS